MREIANPVAFEYGSLEEAFPAVDCGHTPFGEFVIVQIRNPKRKTKGGIILTTNARETEQNNTQVAKVILVGPMAFHSRQDGSEWPGGPWYKAGDFVRCPKYGGDRWTIPYKQADGSDDEACFAIFKDLECHCAVSDPLAVKAFI